MGLPPLNSMRGALWPVARPWFHWFCFWKVYSLGRNLHSTVSLVSLLMMVAGARSLAGMALLPLPPESPLALESDAAFQKRIPLPAQRLGIRRRVRAPASPGRL